MEERKTKKEEKFRGLCSDTAFKYLWKNEKTRKVLEDIVILATGIDLCGYKLIDNEVDLNLDSRVYVMDIVLEHDKNLVNIEMNPAPIKDYIPIRNHNYLYVLAGSRFASGEDFTNRKVTQINFNMSYCKKDRSVCISRGHLSDIEQGLVLDDSITNFEIYLSNYKSICYNKDKHNELESYLSLFNAKNIQEMKKLSNGNKEMNILVDELERLNNDEHFKYMYDKELVDKKTMNTAYSVGLTDGILRGKTAGRKETQKETAIAMLKDKIDISKIAQYTGLSIEDIEQLQKES